MLNYLGVFPYRSDSKETAQCGRPRSDPWIRKILWRREWQSIPVLSPGELPGQRILMDYSPCCCKQSDSTE